MSPLRVVMVSQNEWRHDSRLIREAETLAEAGHDVHVICRQPPGEDPTVETIGGVTYRGVPSSGGETPVSLLQLALAHVRVRLLMARPLRRESLSVLAGIVLVPFALPGVVGFLLVRRIWRGVLRRVGLLASDDRPRAPSSRLAGVLEAVRYLDDGVRAWARAVVALRPDVVHAHDLIALSGAAVASHASGARLVYDAHELETHTNYHLLSPVTKRWIARYEATLVPRCDAVVTVCDSIADWLAEAYSVQRPVVVLNAPVRGAERGEQTVRRALGLEESVPLVVYVGSVTVDRGLELAVESIARLPDAHLATVGPRQPDTERAMRERAATEEVSGRVHFLDPVPPSEVVSFIADASLSLIPIQNVCLSYAFCFPNKLLESVFAGLPVVAADLVELRRFLDENPVGILVDETDPAAIAAAISEVLRRREELAPTPAVIDDIEERYGWATQERRLLELYRRLGPQQVADPKSTGLQLAS